MHQREPDHGATVETTERVTANRMSLPGQMLKTRLETARLHYGELLTLAEVRQRAARTLPWRLGVTRRARVEAIEQYSDPIPDEALLKYDDARGKELFSCFSVVTPHYASQPESDPWIVGQLIGADLWAVIAQW